MDSGKENAHRLVSGCTIREEGLGVVKDLRTWSFRSARSKGHTKVLRELDGPNIYYIYIFYLEVRCCRL